MFRSRIPALVLLSITVPVLVVGGGRSTNNKPASTTNKTKAEIELKQQAASHVANLPIYFEPNRGQTDPSVSYLANFGRTRLFLTRDSAVFSIQKGTARPAQKDFRRIAQKGAFEPPPAAVPPAVVKMRTVNALRGGEDQPLERLPGISNYFIGNDKSKWVTDVPQFAKVKRHGVYPGIDLVFYGNQHQFEYDFLLSPGADAGRIELAYDGVDSIRTNAAGDLVLATTAGDFIQKKPKVYQQRNGRQTEVASNYRISADKTVRFELAQYDRTQPLVIDPVIVFNAIVGSSSDDVAAAVAIDSSQSSYVAGYSVGPDFPLANAYRSAFTGGQKIVIFKLNSAGSALVYSTYVGGEGADTGAGLAVDSNGEAIISGFTTSLQYPILSAAQPSYGGGQFDGVLTKLSAAGNSLVFSTYLGGTGSDQDLGTALDPSGNIYVVGVTDGGGTGNFPVTSGVVQSIYGGGANDCTVSKFTSSGGKLYTTFVGGNNVDICVSVASDSSGSAYITGATSSTNYPRTNGAAETAFTGGQPAIITKLNSTATAYLYSTFFGGNTAEEGYAIAVDSQGAAYITGQTESTAGLPLTSGAVQTSLVGAYNAFLAKVAPSGGSFEYATYFGGRKTDGGFGIALDSSDNAYIVGSTLSDNFPTTNALITAKPGVGGVIMASTDGGVTFTTSDAGIRASQASTILDSDGYLLALPNGTLFESNNNGSSWVAVSLGSNNAFGGLVPSAGPSSTIYAYPVLAGHYLWSSPDGVDWNPVVTLSFSPTSMAVNPLSSTTLIASSATTGSGGTVFESTNGGGNWNVAGANLTLSTISVTFSTTNSALACASNNNQPGLVYRVTTIGGNWALSTAGLSGSSVCRTLLADPNNPGTVYLSASDGLYKSINSGTTWTLLTGLPVSYPILAVAPGNSNLLIAANPNGGLYQSSNGGTTWTATGSALSATTINGIAISPSNNNDVYVSTDISSQGTGFVTALSPGSGSYIYSTYLGGLDGSDKQFAEAIAVDASGNAYVTGQTASAYYGATPGAVNQGYGGWDIFVTKISQASGSCQISVANSSLLAYGSGGVFPLSIFAPAGCTWTATPNASWVSLFGLSSASGSAGTLALVAGNGGSARSTTISFTTGQSITINQTAGSCSYGFVPSSGLAAASGGGGGANLNVGSGCAWNAVSSEPWLTISNASGSGTSGINYTVAANPDNSNRTATITVSNAIYTLTQSAQSGGCTYTVSPSTFYVGPRGTNANLTGALTVTAPPGCAWSASPSASNISMITGSGTGTGTATYSVAANTSNTTGTGISYSISVTGGASQTVRQASAGDRGNAAVFRSPGQWWMDLNGDYAWIAGTDRVLTYGQPGDIPIVGDWDNTGWYRIGIFRQGQWWLDMNGDGQWTANADIVFNYGEAGDVPVVGDWTYTGVQRIGVFRQGQWWLDINNDHAWTQGVDALYIFGQAGDVPLMGNWDNSGQLKPGIFRQGQWWMSIGGDWNWIGGRDRLVIFGQAGDAPLIGDWTHTNDYRIGVFRGGQWWLDINGDFAWTGAPDKLYIYGQAGDTPIVNNWY